MIPAMLWVVPLLCANATLSVGVSPSVDDVNSALAPMWAESIGDAVSALNLSEEQNHAVKALHAEYARGYYKQLADRAAALADDRNAIVGERLDTVALYVESWDAFVQVARRVDRTFLQDVRKMLTEGQQQRLELLHAKRRREYALFQADHYPASNISLPALVSELELAPEQVDKLLGAVHSGEMRMTRAYDDAYAEYRELYVHVIAPAFAILMEDGDAQPLQEAAEQAEEVFRRTMAALLRVQRESLERVAGQLPPRRQLQLYTAFAEHVHPELAFVTADELLASVEIDDHDPQRVRRVLAEYVQSAVELAQMMIQVNERRQGADAEAMEHEKQLERLVERYEQLVQQTRERLGRDDNEA